MHITHVVINLIAKKRALEKDCHPSVDFRVVGDDNVINDNTMYLEYLNIQKLLEQPMSIEKNIVSNAQGNRKVFCNFLKIISYGEFNFRAFNWTNLINYFKNPVSGIYDAYTELVKINNSFPIASMYAHTCKSKELMSASNDDFNQLEERISLFDDLYAWMYASQTLGGLGMGKINISLSFTINISYFLTRYGFANISNESLIYLMNRNGSKHFQRLEDSLLRNLQILYGFGHELSLLNKVIEKVRKASLVETFDTDDLIDILTKANVDKSTLTSPMLIILSKMLIDQRLEIKTKKSEFSDMIFTFMDKAQSHKVSEEDVSSLKLLIKPFLKFNVYTVDSVLDLSSLEEPAIVNGISKAVKKSLIKQTAFRNDKIKTLKIRAEIDQSLDEIF